MQKSSIKRLLSVRLGMHPALRFLLWLKGGSIKSLHVRRQLMAYLFVSPAIFFIGFFVIYPIVNVVKLSFFSWQGLGPRIFVGLANFRKLLYDPSFHISTYNTLLFTVVTVVGLVGVGLLLAIALHRRVTGWRVFRVIFYLNCMLSVTAVGILWGSILNPSLGAMNQLLSIFNLTSPSWFGNPKIVMWVLIGVTCWQWCGFPMLFLYTALEGIPQVLYEAAALDGVTPFKRARYITLPLIKHVLLTIILLEIIFSFRVFDIVFTMTRGGPGTSSYVLTLYMYKVTFGYSKYGYGASLAVIMLIFVLIVTVFYMWIARMAKE